ncbi:hypothetical protein EXW59_06800 [Bacillus mycoides]|uniref:hypothetical protein n=1 Tax=Bacillus mycoides TaxID=1405 RepID=UPI001C0305C5|nr:hypothetical protein [Bacillus mycoides]QWH76428.1 hypothetical protein EXW59_06800 [Bacillus mycoides]
MRYFEFNKHDYYALMAVKDGGEEKAIELYVENVAGESIEEVEEGLPVEITREQALSKYLDVMGKGDISEWIKMFNQCENLPVLIDGTLV